MEFPERCLEKGARLRETRALTDQAVTMFVLISMLPRTDFEYGQI
ncbi:hypothetical protein BH160DRAFT_1619 [Burkholderia sp. H160]|nr:hypothetical protein BH160DRAFT_1619 [Burkholderia sp. H160]